MTQKLLTPRQRDIVERIEKCLKEELPPALVIKTVAKALHIKVTTLRQRHLDNIRKRLGTPTEGPGKRTYESIVKTAKERGVI